MEEDVDDVHEEEKLVLQEDLESKSSKLILNKFEEESREKQRIVNKKFREKQKNKRIAEKKYEDSQKQLKIEQNKQRIEQNKQRRANEKKQKRDEEQKQKRQEAINKKRNDLKPFRSSLECRWNQECKYGCGYIHLDRATPSMKSNCCMNGKLSPLQANPFYERYGVLQPLSPGMQDLLINNIEHMGPLSSTYSNVLSIAAIGVENGNKATGVKNTHVGGFEIRGQGAPDCVTMYGRSFHYLTKATDSLHTIEKIGMLFNIFTSIMILIAVIL
jgi:superfamily II DNA/RNA helicase